MCIGNDANLDSIKSDQYMNIGGEVDLKLGQRQRRQVWANGEMGVGKVYICKLTDSPIFVVNFYYEYFYFPLPQTLRHLSFHYKNI